MNKFPKNPPLCAGKVCLRLLPCPVDQICTSLTSSAPCAPAAVSWTPFCGMDVGSNKIAKQNSSRFLWWWSTVKKGTPLLCNEYGIPLSCAGVFQFWRRIPIWGHVFSMIHQWKRRWLEVGHDSLYDDLDDDFLAIGYLHLHPFNEEERCIKMDEHRCSDRWPVAKKRRNLSSSLHTKFQQTSYLSNILLVEEILTTCDVKQPIIIGEIYQPQLVSLPDFWTMSQQHIWSRFPQDKFRSFQFKTSDFLQFHSFTGVISHLKRHVWLPCYVVAGNIYFNKTTAFFLTPSLKLTVRTWKQSLPKGHVSSNCWFSGAIWC